MFLMRYNIVYMNQGVHEVQYSTYIYIYIHIYIYIYESGSVNTRQVHINYTYVGLKRNQTGRHSFGGYVQ